MKNHMKGAIGYGAILAVALGFTVATEAVLGGELRGLSASPSAPHLANRQFTEKEIIRALPQNVAYFILSPDGKRVAYVFGMGKCTDEDGCERYAAVVDGKQGKTYARIYDPIFAPDSRRFAYSVSEYQYPDTFFVVVDGQEGEHFAGIRSLTDLKFSPDSRSVVYRTTTGMPSVPAFVVVNGNKGKGYCAVGRPTFSPDGKRLAYLATSCDAHGVRDAQFVAADGQEGPHYPALGEDIFFSPEAKRIAYIGDSYVNKVTTYFIVADGREGKHYATVTWPQFSPDGQHLLYEAGVSAQEWVVVLDGKESTKHYWDKQIVPSPIREPVFSPDSQHHAYIATTQPGGNEEYVELDGGENKRYSKVDHLSFSPDSKRVVYVAHNGAYRPREGNESFVVDGVREGKHYPDSLITGIVVSADSAHVAYIVYLHPDTKSQQTLVVLDGKESGPYDEVSHLAFSPDGKTLAYAAYSMKDKKWFMIVNGQKGKPYDYILAKGAWNHTRYFPSSDTFDSVRLSSGKLHYLALSGQRILLVEEQLDVN